MKPFVYYKKAYDEVFMFLGYFFYLRVAFKIAKSKQSKNLIYLINLEYEFINPNNGRNEKCNA